MSTTTLASSPLRQFSSPGRRDSPNTQALLLRRRGELQQSRAGFRARLPCPSATARPLREGDEVSRLGLQLDRSESAPRLVVSKVDEHPRRRTPAAQWNHAERSQAWRPALEIGGDAEFHEPLDLRPGDRIAAVNGVRGSEAMLRELAEAVDGTSPKSVDLAISRDLTEVLQPHLEEVRRAAQSAPLPEGPALCLSTPPPQRTLSPLRRVPTGRLARPASLPLLPRPGDLPEPPLCTWTLARPPLPPSSSASSAPSRGSSVNSDASTSASVASFTVQGAARALRRQKRL